MTDKQIKPDRVHYKVVELSTVTDETIESALNKWTKDGWHFDQIQFVVRDSSRRPSMAFMFFVSPVEEKDEVQYFVHRPESPLNQDGTVAKLDSGEGQNQ